MKRIIFIFSLFFAFGAVNAQSITKILAQAPTMIQTVENKECTVDVAEYTRIGTSANQSLLFLSAGKKYAIFVYGDEKIDNIRLKVYKLQDGNWEFVDNGSNESSSSSLSINPTSDTFYRFDITAASFTSGSSGYYGLLLFHE